MVSMTAVSGSGTWATNSDAPRPPVGSSEGNRRGNGFRALQPTSPPARMQRGRCHGSRRAATSAGCVVKGDRPRTLGAAEQARAGGGPPRSCPLRLLLVVFPVGSLPHLLLSLRHGTRSHTAMRARVSSSSTRWVRAARDPVFERSEQANPPPGRRRGGAPRAPPSRGPRPPRRGTRSSRRR